MNEVGKTPTLMAPSDRGTKYWLSRVLTDGVTVWLQSESWTVNGKGEESKHLVSTPSEVEGKNVGRANETTATEQALAEMQAKLNKKLDEGYDTKRVVGRTEQERPLPMLANVFLEREHTVTYPVAVQPKLDGMRLLYDGKTFWSRKGKVADSKIIAHLHFDTQGHIVDGELLLPPPYDWQDSARCWKKFDAVMTPKLTYVVYDLMSPLPFAERIVLLEQVVAAARAAGFNVVVNATMTADSLDDVLRCHKEIVAKGFEGTIIRSLSAGYAVNARVDALLKLKDFFDAEFEIIGFFDGKGKDKGLIIFTCRTATGQTFDVRPKGTVKERADLFKVGPALVGKELTVRYQCLTKDGKPKFPVGIGIRDYE